METNRTSVRDRSKLWSLFLLRRVLAYAFWGALDVGKVGGALGAVVGLLGGCLLYSLDNYDNFSETVAGITALGLIPGALAGGLMGAILFAGVGFSTRPSDEPKPPRRLLQPIGRGMTMGVLGLAVSAVPLLWFTYGFDAITIVRFRTGGMGLAASMSLGRGLSQLIWKGPLIGIPAAVVLGAIAGAVVGLRREGRRADL